MTRPAILDRLKGVQRAGRGWLAFCPAHNDQHKRSLSVGVGDDGRTLLKCHAAGCTAEQITSAVHMTLADLAPPAAGNSQRPARRQEVASYDYTDERGALLYQVVRFEPKDFRCRRPDGHDGWTWNLDGVRVVPYRLDELAEAQRVYVPEGEKDCDTLAGLGLRATTNHGGAGKWRPEHTAALVAAAVSEVVCIPDHDAPGEAHARAVAGACLAAGLRAKVLRLSGLPDKGDVSDWLGDGHTAAELEGLAEAAPLFVADEPAEAGTEEAPTITAVGDDYRAAWSDDLEFVAVAPRESGEGIHAEVTVSLRGVVLSWGRLNLASTSMREGLVKKLRDASLEVPWRERLEAACRLIVERVRAGSPFEPIIPAPRPATADLIHDVLPLHETSIIYADGDSGKGWLGLAMALALATGKAFPHIRPARAGLRVAYLDWETTKGEVDARVDALCRGLGVTLPPGAMIYRQMSRALADDAPRLRADLERHGVEFVIVDSFVPACGAEPEGADATIRMMNALRTLRRTTRLVIAHVNRVDADKTSGTTRPWGSVFVRNLARATWEVKRATPDGDDLVLACYLTKRNDGKRGTPPWGLRFRFAPDGAVTVEDEPLARTPDLLSKATAWQQIHAALANGPKTAEAVALELDLNVKTVRKTLERRRDLGHVVNPPGSDPLWWALATRREPA